MDLILSRKSVRKFKGTKVEDALVEDLLRAGMQAPSAGNEQPWEFVVVRNRQLMREITTFHPYAQALLSANAAIIVCGSLARERFEGFWVQDCSAATENILLAAEARGLGAVWLGVYPLPERVEPLKQLLDLPEEVIPFSIVPIGYPDENRTGKSRYDAARVHRDRW